MTEDVWAERDTNPDAIDAALRELLRARHAANTALAPARVLNLVVIVDREWKGEIANRLERVGRYHASRTILCAVEEGRTTLDATAVDVLRRTVQRARRDSRAGRDRHGTGAPVEARHDHRSRPCVGTADRPVVAPRPRGGGRDRLPHDRRDAARLRRRVRPVGGARSRRRGVAVGVRGRSGVAAHDPVARAAGGELRPT